MIIIKAGGGRAINWDYIAEDVKTLIDKGERVLIVHGANVKRDEVAERLGHPTKTITSPTGISSVYTDKEALEVFLMAYAGLVNKQIVAAFIKHGVRAVGLSGIDGGLWRGKRKKAVYSQEATKVKLITDNLTGRVDEINVELINLLLENGYTPVITPPALTSEAEIINTDSDWATAVMAGSLGVTKMVVLFEAPGFLKKFGNESSLIKMIDRNKLDNYMFSAVGRMKKKLLAAKEAFKVGLKTLYWSDGRVKNPVANALLGSGTTIE